jgi:hypothetical protein
MEAIGFKKRLNEALINSETIKIIFQYPSSDRAIIKSGKVLSVDIDSFTIDEKLDGDATYSYNYIVEIKEVRE